MATEPAEERAPTGSYTALMTVYGALAGGFLVWTRLAGRELPRPTAGDLILGGVATHKASRLLARDKVTRPLRAPFTEPEGESDMPSELEEAPRGSGLRRAVGELVSCPYCLALWVAGAFLAGLTIAPRATRFAASLLGVVTIADFLHPAYRAVGADPQRRGRQHQSIEPAVDTRAAEWRSPISP